jgi:cell division protein FtsA
MVQQVTNLPARVAAPQGVSGMNDEIQGPDHATVVGLLRWGARSRGRVARPSNGVNGHTPTGEPVGERFGRWLRELF